MTVPCSRRSVLRCPGGGSTTALAGFAGCSAPDSDSRVAPVPAFVDTRDDADRDVRAWVDGTETEDAFHAGLSVEAGALVRVTDVGAEGFRLHARVRGLDDDELAECPAPDDADHSPGGYAVVVPLGSAAGDGSGRQIPPVRTAEPSAEASE